MTPLSDQMLACAVGARLAGGGWDGIAELVGTTDVEGLKKAAEAFAKANFSPSLLKQLRAEL